MSACDRTQPKQTSYCHDHNIFGMEFLLLQFAHSIFCSKISLFLCWWCVLISNSQSNIFHIANSFHFLISIQTVIPHCKRTKNPCTYINIFSIDWVHRLHAICFVSVFILRFQFYKNSFSIFRFVRSTCQHVFQFPICVFVCWWGRKCDKKQPFLQWHTKVMVRKICYLRILLYSVLASPRFSKSAWYSKHFVRQYFPYSRHLIESHIEIDIKCVIDNSKKKKMEIKTTNILAYSTYCNVTMSHAFPCISQSESRIIDWVFQWKRREKLGQRRIHGFCCSTYNAAIHMPCDRGTIK